MAQHNVTVIATSTPVDHTVPAVTGFDGATDSVAVEDGNVVGVIDSVSDVLGVTLDLVTVGSGVATNPLPGDTILIVGSVGSIPDFQVGLTLTVDQDGIAHMNMAGAISAIITDLQTP